MLGTIERLVEDRGFGFVRPNGYAKTIFFHVRDARALSWDARLLNQRVEFEVAEDKQGREVALNVRPAT